MSLLILILCVQLHCEVPMTAKFIVLTSSLRDCFYWGEGEEIMIFS